jgi:hypothetical protein
MENNNLSDQLFREQCLKTARERFLKSDLLSLMSHIMKADEDFSKHTILPEGDIKGEISVTLTRKDIIFIFDSDGELRFVANGRPRPKPSPLAGACALKVA